MAYIDVTKHFILRCTILVRHMYIRNENEFNPLNELVILICYIASNSKCDRSFMLEIDLT